MYKRQSFSCIPRSSIIPNSHGKEEEHKTETASEQSVDIKKRMVLLVKSKRSLLLPFAACILQAALTCSYPTKEVVQLEDPSKKDGGDGGCLSGTHCECKHLLEDMLDVEG